MTVPQPHGEGMDGGEPGLACCLCESWPPLLGAGQVGVHDRFGGGVAVNARALVDLELEELEQSARLVGGGEVLQLAVVVGEHQSDRVGATD